MKKLISFILSIVIVLSTYSLIANAAVGDFSFYESESNNTFATADQIGTNYTVHGTINGQYDMDYFEFTLSSSSKIHFLSSCKSNALLIGIYDSADNLITVGLPEYNNGYYHNTIDDTLSSGTYYILLLQNSTYSSLSYAFYFEFESTGHSHSYSSVVTNPTCTSDGYTTYTCSCGYSYEGNYITAIGHNPITITGIEATCTQSGLTNGIRCTICNSIIEAQKTIPAKGHNWSEWETSVEEQVKRRTCTACNATEEETIVICTDHNYIETIVKATTLEDGYKNYECQMCGNTYKEVICKISSVKLSTSKVTYNGKKRTPNVIVTDTNGTKLVKDTDYSVTYESGRKLPGVYIVTITFKGNYEGSKNLKFTIKPKATTGIKATEKTGTSITLSWSKTTGATGYRVYQYSSSKGKYVTKKTTTNLKYKVTGLKKNTSYKFKIKPYTKMEDGTVIWGESSEVFSVKTTKGYGVDISGTSATLYVGKTKQLKATTTPSSKTVTWKSSKKSVATVSSSGKVTAKAPGTATITAVFEYKGVTYKDTFKVTVKTYIGSKTTKVSMKETQRKKVLIETNGPLESISYRVVEGSNIIDCSWGDWENNNIYLTIKPSCGGSAKIKIFDTYDEENYFYIDVTIKATTPTEFGDITGNVTYYYNDFKGDVSDTGSEVILIPTNGRALGLELEKTQYTRWWTGPLNEWNEKYGIYGTEVDGKGEYYLSDVPVGKYIIFVISNETSSGEWFDDDEAYAENIAYNFDGYLSRSAAIALGEAVSYHKYYVGTVTIKNNYVSHKSVDFGITYI